MRYVDKAAYFEKIGYKPHRKQWLYHNSPARFRAPVCGRRFGKSKMAGVDLEPELFLPKRRYWAVGPNYDLGEKEFRVVWDDLIIGQKLGRDKRVRRAYNKRSGEMYIEFPWQTRFEVRSAMHPETLVGEALDGVIISEAAKQNPETWERFIRPALADRRGWGTFPTTPEGMNWLHVLWQMGQNPAYPDYDSWQFPSWFNEVVYPGGEDDPEIRLLKQTMSVEEFEQEIAANFTQFRGRIYPEFDEQTHVKPHTYNPMWPNYLFMDFGYKDPFVALDVQMDPWQRLYVWRERYVRWQTLSEHIEAMKARPNPLGYKVDLAFGDAADPESIAYFNANYGPCMALPEAKTNWRQGIETVKQSLKLRQVGEADEYGTPLEESWLTVTYDCPNTIREFNNYKTKDTDKSSTTESKASGVAQRTEDHSMDAIRYGEMHLFVLGATSHLSDIPSSQNLGSVLTAPSSGYFTTGMRF